jgi:hypothetical protein
MFERVIKSEPQTHFTSLWVGKVATFRASNVNFGFQSASLM